MPENKKYPKIDRSNFIPNPHTDASYIEGILKDGRPYRVECWFEQGFTYLSIFFSSIGIEDVNEAMLKAMLVSDGLVEFDDEKYLSSGFNGINVEAKKDKDASGNEMWVLTIIVGDEDGTYANTSFSMKKYKFLYKKNPHPKEYFVAICEEEGLYQSYFINNSDKRIELMREKGKYEYKNIHAKTFVKLHTEYFDWDFDWLNQINIYLKVDEAEFFIDFKMEKLFIARKEEPNIPIINRSGWICN